MVTPGNSPLPPLRDDDGLRSSSSLTDVERLGTNTDGDAVDVVGLNNDLLVGPTGIEPMTSTV